MELPMNPITSLVTIVLAAIGALLFLARLICRASASASSPCSCCSR